jgi:hypothetical protein
MNETFNNQFKKSRQSLSITHDSRKNVNLHETNSKNLKHGWGILKFLVIAEI